MKAGTYYGLPDEDYHGRKDSLSYSGAKLLLPPSCPARFRYEQDHGRKPKAAWDRGHAVHKIVFGVGPEITVIDADNWMTKAAKEQRAAAYEASAVPLLRKEYEPAQDMAAAIHAHPLASRLLDLSTGEPEVSMFMLDPETGVPLRSRVDFLPHARDGRMILPDLKTSASAEPEAFAKSAANYSYNMQSVFYQDMVTGLGLADEVIFVFVVVEIDPPYVVSIIQLDEEAERIGRALKRQAIDIYQECTSTGRWPGYADDVALVQLPRWYARQHSEDQW